MKIITILISLIILNFSLSANDSKDTPFEWNFDFGYETGKYKIPITDEGDYGGIFIGSRLGFNIGRAFLGAAGKLSFASFSSARGQGAVDRVSNPLPNKNSTLWGPTFAYKFKWVHFYYTYFLESHKFDGSVDVNGVDTNLVYRYEGAGHDVGLGFRLYGNIFLTYNFRSSELEDQKQKVDGTYTAVETREHPMKIYTHVIGIRVPINLSKLPGYVSQMLFGS